MTSREDIYNYLDWRHRIKFGPNDVTPGHYRAQWEELGLPESLDGKSFLELSAWDGMYSFEAERRGADRVLATDVWDIEDVGYSSYSNGPSKNGFELIHDYLDSDVESKTMNVFDVRDEVDEFDIVFCKSAIPYTHYPRFALNQLGAITREKLVLQMGCPQTPMEIPTMRMFDETLDWSTRNRWFLNPELVRATLSLAGFDTVEVQEQDLSNPQFEVAELAAESAIYQDCTIETEKQPVEKGTPVTIRGEYENSRFVEIKSHDGADNRSGWIRADDLQDLTGHYSPMDLFRNGFDSVTELLYNAITDTANEIGIYFDSQFPGDITSYTVHAEQSR